MIQTHNDYEIDDSRERIDFARVQSWLAGTYWSPGISQENVERAAQFSILVMGAYHNGQQVGYARIVSDTVRFAWVCDVFVEDTHRGKGLARAMVRYALEHPTLEGNSRWLLGTLDAHGVYAKLGFKPLASPERFMIYIPSNPESSDPCRAL